jgi:hypothetical protein
MKDHPITIRIMPDGLEVNVRGDQRWFKNNRLHREDGPAVVFVKSGYWAWYFEGWRHRLDGSAVRLENGREQWWVNGEALDCQTQEEFERLMKLRAFWG